MSQSRWSSAPVAAADTVAAAVAVIVAAAAVDTVAAAAAEDAIKPNKMLNLKRGSSLLPRFLIFRRLSRPVASEIFLR
jgi:hypothetical protein